MTPCSISPPPWPLQSPPLTICRARQHLCLAPLPGTRLFTLLFELYFLIYCFFFFFNSLSPFQLSPSDPSLPSSLPCPFVPLFSPFSSPLPSPLLSLFVSYRTLSPPLFSLLIPYCPLSCPLLSALISLRQSPHSLSGSHRPPSNWGRGKGEGFYASTIAGVVARLIGC